MANHWLISDMHFWHENMYKFTYTDATGVERRVREKFATCKEGDEYMIQRWNEIVRPSDHIWCLGDVCMERGNNRVDAFVQLIRGLNGHKRLVLGNHDHYAVGVYVDAGFQKVRASNMIDGLLMTHYPVHPSSIGFRVTANVHGHIHQQNSPPGKYINVSVEKTDYAPIALEEVKAMAERLKDVGTSGATQGIEG